MVGKKEGRCSRKVADLSEFWNGQKNIVLCDTNILACKEWKPLLQQLIDSKAYVDFNQGLDIRMMTEEKAMMLSQIKVKELHFAWDRYEDKDMVLPKFKTLAKMLETNTQMSKDVCCPKMCSAIIIDFSGMMTRNRILKKIFVKTLIVFIKLKRPALFSFLSIAKGMAAAASTATMIPSSNT